MDGVLIALGSIPLLLGVAWMVAIPLKLRRHPILELEPARLRSLVLLKGMFIPMGAGVMVFLRWPWLGAVLFVGSVIGIQWSWHRLKSFPPTAPGR